MIVDGIFTETIRNKVRYFFGIFKINPELRSLFSKHFFNPNAFLTFFARFNNKLLTPNILSHTTLSIIITDEFY